MRYLWASEPRPVQIVPWLLVHVELVRGHPVPSRAVMSYNRYGTETCFVGVGLGKKSLRRPRSNRHHFVRVDYGNGFWGEI